jgi:diaminopimelate decarboxylase
MTISDIIKKVETPCFLLQEEELRRSISGFQQALSNEFNCSTVGYSVKTNSVPYCLNIANSMGCYAEVVSADEYNLAKLCGFHPQNIIYNGPLKNRDSFVDAITGGAILNIETKREIDWLQELPKDKTYSVGIRLNINISHISPEDADGDNDNSRFGFSEETSEFHDALSIINRSPNIHLAGLHIHRTAHSRSLRFYENSIRFACETIRKYNLNIDYLDIGGGYFGIFANKPTFVDYAQIFRKVLEKYNLTHLHVIVEPGNGLVASCFHFISEVIDVKHVEKDCWFVTTDGSRNDIDPFFRKSSYMTQLFSSSNGPTVKEQIVSGCTCLEYDRIFTIDNSNLMKVGDHIMFRNVGAYTMCLSPLFIRYFPNIYVINEETLSLIREKWGAKEFLQKSRNMKYEE